MILSEFVTGVFTAKNQLNTMLRQQLDDETIIDSPKTVVKTLTTQTIWRSKNNFTRFQGHFYKWTMKHVRCNVILGYCIWSLEIRLRIWGLCSWTGMLNCVRRMRYKQKQKIMRVSTDDCDMRTILCVEPYYIVTMRFPGQLCSDMPFQCQALSSRLSQSFYY